MSLAFNLRHLKVNSIQLLSVEVSKHYYLNNDSLEVAGGYKTFYYYLMIPKVHYFTFVGVGDAGGVGGADVLLKSI